MFKAYYKKDIAEIVVNQKLRVKLSRELFPAATPSVPLTIRRIAEVFKKPFQYFSIIGASSTALLFFAWIIFPTHVADANDSLQTNIVQPILATVHIVRIIPPQPSRLEEDQAAHLFVDEAVLQNHESLLHFEQNTAYLINGMVQYADTRASSQPEQLTAFFDLAPDTVVDFENNTIMPIEMKMGHVSAHEMAPYEMHILVVPGQ
ncbi:MAG: hypothetical protein HYV32_02835 [Candidatus Kerfeldbacteria bacterium]|nr:hypothetical protein [Candidatus Kerfeldbacteria bacterium]